MTTRQAHLRWEGGFRSGTGRIVSSSSGALNGADISWPARTAGGDGSVETTPETTPEELLAAAHASCFSMALAAILEREGFRATYLDVTANVSFENARGEWSITKSTLDVVGSVPGIDEVVFNRIAEKAKASCPMSRVLQGNVEIEMVAVLSSDVLAASAGP